MKRSLLLSLILFTTACGTGSKSSQVKSILDKNDIRFLSTKDIEADQAAQSMVILLNVVTVGETAYGAGYCSGFFISPRHIMSAAHCYNEKNTVAYDSNFRVREGEQDLMSFTQLGREIRLTYNGTPDLAYFEDAWKKRPYLGSPRFLDREHDVVIWELDTDRAPAYINWNVAEENLNHLRLLGYQNSTPLSQSDACSGELFGNGRVLRHDCDSLSGGSGGLIVDDQGRAVALHVLGGGQNLWSYYSSHQSFETLDDAVTLLTPRAPSIKTWECSSEPSEEARLACVIGGGRNRAIHMSWIRTLVLEKDAGLAQAIEAVQTTSACTQE